MSFTKKDVKVKSKEVLYKGFFEYNRYAFTHPLFAGGQSGLVKREVFERGHAVGVLPYDPILDELVLLEQFRFPAMETTSNPWLIEVVAGIIDEGETPEEVCYREAKEEAGINITDLKKISSYLTTPGASTERIELFIARVDANTAKGIHGLDTEAEDIKVLRVPFAQAKDYLESGKIDNSTAIIAIQWLLLNKAKLLKLWNIK